MDQYWKLSLLERNILSMLPVEGDTIGGHELAKPVRSIVEDLDYVATAAEVNGVLRTLNHEGLALLGTGARNTRGWQATKRGHALVEQWESMLLSRALTLANRDGDGLAQVKAKPGGRVVAYVMTPARYERVADDPAAGSVELEPKELKDES